MPDILVTLPHAMCNPANAAIEERTLLEVDLRSRAAMDGSLGLGADDFVVTCVEGAKSWNNNVLAVVIGLYDVGKNGHARTQEMRDGLCTRLAEGIARHFERMCIKPGRIHVYCPEFNTKTDGIYLSGPPGR